MANQSVALRKVNGQDRTPKYLQAREILVAAIRSGHFAPGDRLPSTAQISSLVDVSLITAQKALEGLVEMGLLRREVGRGTYVREDFDPSNVQQPRLSIALVLPGHVNIDDYYHSTLIQALRREARDDLRHVEFSFNDRYDVPTRTGKEFGAICIHPPIESQADVERLARRAPVVVLGGTMPGDHVACVDCDNAGGAALAIRHLVGLGHRRVLVLSGPTNMTNSRDRVNGAQAELQAAGLKLTDRDLLVSRDSVVLDEGARARLAARLSAKDRPTAIFAGGFYLAMAAMQVARQAGLRLPQDVSVVGFDDPTSAALLDPPLTTVRQPLPKMAARAFQLLANALQDRDAPVHGEVLPAEFIVRGSTAAPPPPERTSPN
ncbi:MAG: GntR family transcriptional regulator [Planctomycetia bacterium]|nr:MAG: GntR family transcriptional regulator [Planctomycetia bacterium]